MDFTLLGMLLSFYNKHELFSSLDHEQIKPTVILKKKNTFSALD